MNRRIGIAAVLLLGTLLGKGAVTPGRVGAASGTTDQAVAYQINVAHSGNLSGDALAPPLVKQWSRANLGGTVSYPLIAGGKVFVTVGGPFTSTTGSYPPKWIYALDESTGATIWSHQISGVYDWVNAAYDNGTVYVLNYNGLLQTFNADTGAASWSVDIYKQTLNYNSFSSPPTAANGVVYVAGAGGGGSLFAVSESNGSILWSQVLNTADNSSPTLSSTSVFIADVCNVYAFSQSGGAPSWRDNFGCSGGGGATAVLGSNGLYARQEGVPAANYILDPATGKTTGQFSAGPAPAFSGSTGFFLYNHTLRAIDSAGSTVWSFTGDGSLDTAPIVVNGDVYVGSSTGMLYAVDIGTGQSVWSDNVGTSIQAGDEYNPPLVSGLGAGEGHLVVPAGTTLTAYTAQNPDVTPPVITPSVNGPQGSNGWYTGATTVSWSLSDPETGISLSSGCNPTTLSSDTTGTTLTCTATNGVGLTSSSSVTIKIDQTPPALTCSPAPTGWSASDVSINCQSNDIVSQLAKPSDVSFSLSTSVPSGSETSSATTPSRTVCDAAGNCATAGPYAGLRVDKLAPSINLTAPSGTYTLNQSVVASYACTDGGSSVATCSGPVPSGQPISTGSVGTKTFTVNAADAVGNAASPVSAGYTVRYGVCQSAIPSAKSGHTVNVGIQLCDANSANVSSPAVSVTASAIVNSSGTQVRSMNNAFTYTSSLNNNGGGYMDKVDTTGLPTGTYYVVFTAGGDPTSHQAAFSVK